MPARPKSPSAQRRLIALTLKELREKSGKDMKDAASVLDRTISWVGRAERAEMTPSTGDLKVLLDYYGIDPNGTQAQAILGVARLARQRGGWWHSYTDIMPKDFGNFVGLETAASSLREYEPQLIPGLLQTQDYARAVLLAGNRTPKTTDLEEKLAIRVQRQHLLDVDDPPEVRVVIDEGAMHREIGGPKVLREQLEHLMTVAERPSVTIQVLPYGSGAHPGLDGPFTIIDFPPPPAGYPDTIQPRLIYIESMMNAWYLEKPEEIIAYGSAWDALCCLAHTPADSVALLRTIADDLSKTRSETEGSTGCPHKT